MPSPAAKYVKIMMYLKRRPDVSDEQFHHRWSKEHVEIALSNPVFKSKILRFNQFHVSETLKLQAASLGAPVLDYDGIAEFWVSDVQDWKDITSDKDFVKHMAEDELIFVQPPISVMVGYDNLVIGLDRKTGMETQINGDDIGAI
ncbi:hypothetical protein BJX99DRAFT_264189 [Aspergillus californicus]